MLDPGDEALVLTPAWPNGSSIIAMANAVAKQIPHPLCGDRYQIDFDALEAAAGPRTRLLLYTSPSNPLGWVATEDEQQRLLDFCRARGMWLVADEVYDRLYYAGARLGRARALDSAQSHARRRRRRRAFVFEELLHDRMARRLARRAARSGLKATQLNEFIISHAPSFAQKAAETALACGEAELSAMLQRLKENRDFCLAALREMPGVTVPEPDGAFYLFPKIEGLADSFEFCRRLLMETKVGLAPGVAFGAGWRRLRAHLLRGRPLHSRARHGTARALFAEWAPRLEELQN